MTDNAAKTFARYLAACEALGFGRGRMEFHVWERCEADAREHMARQLETEAAKKTAEVERLQQAGLAWGAF